SPVPDTDGTPAQSAEVFSSWHVAEQPSPFMVPPSSHSSVSSARPSPHTTVGGGAQSAGAVASAALSRPAMFRWNVAASNRAHQTSEPIVKCTSIGPTCDCGRAYDQSTPLPAAVSCPPAGPGLKTTLRTPSANAGSIHS